MSKRRTERVGALLRHAIAGILLREIKDPRIAGVTVTDVDVSPDLRHAYVYYRLLDAQGEREGAQEGLQHAAGFIQGLVSRELRLRYTPELRFTFDSSLERVARVEELLSGEEQSGSPSPSDRTLFDARRSTRR